jgi:hypothetical protein
MRRRLGLGTILTLMMMSRKSQRRVEVTALITLVRALRIPPLMLDAKMMRRNYISR